MGEFVRESALMNETKEIQDPNFDVLTEGWLHKVMVLFHRPHTWNKYQVAAVGLLVSGIVSLAWYREAAPTLVVGAFGIHLLFLMLDVLMLVNLPKKELSFGPWQSQLAALTVPRFLVSVILALILSAFAPRVDLIVLLVVQLIGTAAFYYGAYVEPFKLKLTELLVFTDRLPVGLPAMRILHITDLHIERWTRREDDVLRIVNETKPDMIVISGDYVNLSYNQDAETRELVRELLSQISAPFGVYATLGSPPVDLRENILPIFEGLDVNLMRNGWEVVDFEDGRKLTILGMDCTHHIPTDEARLAHLMSQAPNDLPQLFLYHSPELMPQAAAQGIDLYLCGHTHGGQVRLPIIGPLLTSSQLGRQFVMGHYHLGRTHLYVSRGIGLEGMSAPRVRFMAPPEMTLVIMMPGGAVSEKTG
jgi:predicted MPP superfamily phosphohydrolase